MAYDSNVLRRATARLEEQKRQREEQRERLRRQVYAREPRLAQLDRQMRSTMTQLAAAALRRGESAGDAVRAIRDQNLDIQRERAVLLGAMLWTTSRPARNVGIPAGEGHRCATV